MLVTEGDLGGMNVLRWGLGTTRERSPWEKIVRTVWYWMQ